LICLSAIAYGLHRLKQNFHTFVEKTFIGKSLEMDGKSFNNCVFQQCNLVYSGGNPPVLNGCSFNNCSWQFGGAAARTLGFFAGLYSGGFDQMVEATFQSVRNGNAFTEVPLETEIDELLSAEIPSALKFKPPRILKITKKK